VFSYLVVREVCLSSDLLSTADAKVFSGRTNGHWGVQSGEKVVLAGSDVNSGRLRKGNRCVGFGTGLIGSGKDPAPESEIVMAAAKRQMPAGATSDPR